MGDGYTVTASVNGTVIGERVLRGMRYFRVYTVRKLEPTEAVVGETCYILERSRGWREPCK